MKIFITVSKIQGFDYIITKNDIKYQFRKVLTGVQELSYNGWLICFKIYIATAMVRKFFNSHWLGDKNN